MTSDFSGDKHMESHMPQGTELVTPILRLREVEALTGRKRSSIYEDIAAGRMPRQLKLGPRAVGWLRSEIERWQAERVAERDSASQTQAFDAERVA